MADTDDTNADDSSFRDQLDADGFKADADGMKWGPAQPKILVAGAYKVLRTAAEKARAVVGRSKD